MREILPIFRALGSQDLTRIQILCLIELSKEAERRELRLW